MLISLDFEISKHSVPECHVYVLNFDFSCRSIVLECIYSTKYTFQHDICGYKLSDNGAGFHTASRSMSQYCSRKTSVSPRSESCVTETRLCFFMQAPPSGQTVSGLNLQYTCITELWIQPVVIFNDPEMLNTSCPISPLRPLLLTLTLTLTPYLTKNFGNSSTQGFCLHYYNWTKH